MENSKRKPRDIIAVLCAVFLYIVLIGLMIYQVSDVLDFSFLIENKARLVDGALMTIGISLISLIMSGIIGFLLFLMSERESVFIRTLVRIYNEIIMGTPLLVLVFVVVYILGVAIGVHDKLFLGLLAITMYMSPYMANVFDGAYRSIDSNQFVVMDFYGFNLYQRFRFILFPQMLKPIIPGLINNLSGIIKGTSILSTIAISEIFYVSSVLSNTSYRYVEGYFVLWMVYLIITVPLSFLAKYLAKQEDF